MNSSSTVDKILQQERVLLLARLNKMSTPIISDIFAKLKLPSRCINGLPPVSKKMKICGPAYTVVYADINDKYKALFEINRFHVDDIPAGSVLVIENIGQVNAAAVWGGLVSQAAQKRGVLGTITNGCIRDADEIKEIHFPVFSSGKALKNSNETFKVVSIQNDVVLNDVVIKPGDIIMADNDGIMVIAPAHLQQVVEAAEAKMGDENIISALIEKGNSLKLIHEIMTKKTSYQLIQERMILNAGKKYSVLAEESVQHVYHRKPDNFVGNWVIPLNKMPEQKEYETIYKPIYEKAKLKYEGREATMQVTWPALNHCKWNDVIFLSPIHPNYIYQAFHELKVPIAEEDVFYFKIPIKKLNLDPTKTRIWTFPAASDDPNVAFPPDSFCKVDPATYQELDGLPARTKHYYQIELLKTGKRPLSFFYVPHVVTTEPIDVSGVECVNWKNPRQ